VRPATPRQEERRGWRILLALGVVCLVGGGVPVLAHTADEAVPQDSGMIPMALSLGGPPAGLDPGDAPGVQPVTSAVLGPPPARLRLPRLRIDAPVLPVTVDVNGLLGVPDNPRQLGWWSSSSTPGMPSGSVVIDGHVDSATLGLGALFHLREARPGDEVLLTSAAGRSTRYLVVARRTYPKTTLPADEVFASDVRPRLVLLTCGGAFDQTTRHYADNIVVYAVPR
jgi:Sortase domain